eukprot:scaffold86218_cov66-Phaeocystis_antarctica.AAC.6
MVNEHLSAGPRAAAAGERALACKLCARLLLRCPTTTSCHLYAGQMTCVSSRLKQSACSNFQIGTCSRACHGVSARIGGA